MSPSGSPTALHGAIRLRVARDQQVHLQCQSEQIKDDQPVKKTWLLAKDRHALQEQKGRQQHAKESNSCSAENNNRHLLRVSLGRPSDPKQRNNSRNQAKQRCCATVQVRPFSLKEILSRYDEQAPEEANSAHQQDDRLHVGGSDRSFVGIAESSLFASLTK